MFHFLPESKGYPHSTEALGSKFKIQPQERRVFKRATGKLGKEISKALFDKATHTLTDMAKSTLMRGMAQNTIAKPTFYDFLGQDYIHLKNGEEILRETANLLKSSQADFPFSNMYTKQADKYQLSYNAIDYQLNSEAKVNPMNIKPDSATEAYHQFLIKVSKAHPRLLVFAFLPCSQSFRFIANELWKETEDPVYKKFFEANMRGMGYRSDLEKFIDDTFSLDSLLGTERFKVIEGIYLEGMKQEKNFIDQAAL